jgi:hypothetical protein
MNKKSPCIIFLKGVTSEDYTKIEDVFDMRLVDDIEDSDNTQLSSEYATIPSKYVLVDKWIKSTNLLCWNCNFSFITMPVFVPTYIHKGEHGIIEMGVHGNMCSFNCAANYIRENMDKLHHMNLLYLYNDMTGNSIDIIHPAPSKFIMRKYGGRLTENEYLNELSKLTENINGGSDATIKRQYTKSISFESLDEHPSAWDIDIER